MDKQGNTTANNPATSTGIINAAVIVAALGYFVDIYDLVLFSVTRVQSLRDIGVPQEKLADIGGELLGYWQMLGMLFGGLLWGVLGDKKGRLSVLFGSIVLYSIANIANGFVQTVEQYKLLRLIAGIGLAGELGAGITLVTEVLSKEKRGYGTTIVATIGLLGAVAAFGVTTFFDWRNAYFVGGGLGLLLLLLRISVYESGMFKNAMEANVSRGNFGVFFRNKKLLFRYIQCILIGLPTWYVVGILVTLAPEFGKEFGMETPPATAAQAVMWCYIGLALGDLLSGTSSQVWRSRRKTMALFHTISLATVLFYLFSGNISLQMIYFKCFLLGLGAGYWAVFVTIAAEQFGTNIRATVATTVPNFARGALALIFFVFSTLKSTTGIINSALWVGLTCIGIALTALYFLPETYHKDLDYFE